MSKTMEELYQEMRDDFASRSGLSPNDGGDISLRLHAFAQQLHALWTQAEWLEKQSFPQTAAGENLDRHAALRALERQAATAAQGSIGFYLQQAALTDTPIPLGCVCTTAGGIAFETTEAGVIPAGSLSVELGAQAQSPGADGNVLANGVCLMVNPPVGVAYCLNTVAFTGGTDEETDESLRNRVLQSYRRLPNGANAAFYEAEALSVEGVAAAVVLPKERGLGTVDVVISAVGGIPSAALISRVAAALEAQREICVDIDVYAPTAVPVNLSVSLEGDGREDFDALSDRVSAALTACFDGTLLGKKLTLAELGRVIYAVPGVANYHILSPLTDVTITETQLPTLGTLSITEA